MARLIHFLKTALPDGTYGWGYAERVLGAGERRRAENVAVPVPMPAEPGVRLHAHRLPDGDFNGHSDRILRPEWFGFGGAPAPDSVAPPTALRGRAARLLCTTGLGALCGHPEVRLALAQDRLAAELAPVLAMPDFLMHEDALVRGWADRRPEAAAEAQTAAELVAAAAAGFTGVTRAWRRRIRLAALRRIDAAAVGREIFAPVAAFLGEPYRPFRGPGEWALKVGLVQSAHYWPTPEGEARSRIGRADAALVHALERQLCPWLPAAGGGPAFARALASWTALAPLRDFECRSCWPLFPQRIRFPGAAPPTGFSVRIQPGTLAEQGGSYHTLAAAGLCPFIAEPFQAHCATEADRVAEWAADLPALVAMKWGAFLANDRTWVRRAI